MTTFSTTVCSRSLVSFYTVGYYYNLIQTSWTFSTNLENPGWSIMELNVSDDKGGLDVLLALRTLGIVAKGFNLKNKSNRVNKE